MDATIPLEADVAIVGYGPVGQALALLLARMGHSVVAFERFEEIYRMPRAVHLDHEAMRILQDLGVARALGDDLLPLNEYCWFGADGEPLMTLTPVTPAVSGWEPDYLFFQPTLEEALDAGARQAGATVERGWEATDVRPTADGATLQLRRSGTDASTREVRARWVIGCDGANSLVRESAGIAMRDLGFQERWLVVDVEPAEIDSLDLPRACQWCDPRRPTTHVQSGRRHRRWEFMLLPGEDPADFADPERAWELLSPWFTPEDGRLVRHAVYEFRSMLAASMRAGPVLLAGDSAHLTPPFLGQGLCAGLRDAVNIAWKLDLVLGGLADTALLDTVEAERQAQTEWVINFAIELGRVLCELDPERAAERDRTVREAGPPPEVATPPLSDGVFRSADPLAGQLSVQGRVARDGEQGLLDDVTCGGFTLIARDGDPKAMLDGDGLRALKDLGTTILSLEPGSALGLTDLDGRMGAWLDEAGVHAVVVRPDFYVFGSARAAGDLPALVRALNASQVRRST